VAIAKPKKGKASGRVRGGRPVAGSTKQLIDPTETLKRPHAHRLEC
jgi:hypothetical protein